MKTHALMAVVALSVFACSKEGDKVIFHGDEAKKKTGQAVEKLDEGAEKAAEKTEELGKKAWQGAKELGRETKEEVKESADEIEARERADEKPATPPPTATGGGPATDAGTK